MRKARIYYGWHVAACAFFIALFGWGLGFYGPGIYLVALRAAHGWSTAAISSAVTVYYIAGGVLIIFIGGAIERFGARRVVLAGSLAMALGVSMLTVITELWQLYAAFLVMSGGWASMSGAAVNTIIAPWFDRRRGLAVSLALNGSSCGGIFIAPLLIFLIGALGFRHGLYTGVAVMLLMLTPIVIIVLRHRPEEFGSLPDEEVSPAAQSPPFRPWRRIDALRDRNFLTISIPFALGLAAQVGFLTHQVAFLTPRIGAEAAALCVSLTTIAAVAGRIGTGFVVDRLDRRTVSCANFLLQVAALAVLVGVPGEAALYAGCIAFGLGVGNLVTLPGLIVQQEFPKQHFAGIVSLVVALNQFTFAFGPGLLGLIRDWTGDYRASLIVCMALQAMAAALVLVRRRPASFPL